MDAYLRLGVLVCAFTSLGAAYRTPNFVVTASSDEFARQVGDAAELYRRELAIEWLGYELPTWSAPCPIHVTSGTMGAGGATTFNFDRGEVYGWKMNIQGSPERILDSVLPHEVNHTIFATHFRRPLPRWADEGAASLIEHGSERKRLRDIHDHALRNRKQIPLRDLLPMKDYPQDQASVLRLYAEGHSLADYLIQKTDKATYLRFLNTAHESGWDTALKKHFQYNSVDTLEREWESWAMAGSPALDRDLQLAATPPDVAPTRASTSDAPIIRGQSPSGMVHLGPASRTPPKRYAAATRPAADRTRAMPDVQSPSITAQGKARPAPRLEPTPDERPAARPRREPQPFASSDDPPLARAARPRRRDELEPPVVWVPHAQSSSKPATAVAP